jgi:hypothetical protein
VHTTFSSAVAGWQNFFMLAGTASATLVGLLFVAVSLHLDLIGESGAATILSLARRTFTRFILVVVVALLFLVPSQDPLGLGLPLLALGIADTVRSVRAARASVGPRKGRIDLRDATNRIVLPVVLPLLSSLGLIAVAASVLVGETAYLYWVVPIIAGILANAATNSWNLMLGLARYKDHRQTGEASIGGESK